MKGSKQLAMALHAVSYDEGKHAHTHKTSFKTTHAHIKHFNEYNNLTNPKVKKKGKEDHTNYTHRSVRFGWNKKKIETVPNYSSSHHLCCKQIERGSKLENYILHLDSLTFNVFSFVIAFKYIHRCLFLMLRFDLVYKMCVCVYILHTVEWSMLVMNTRREFRTFCMYVCEHVPYIYGQICIQAQQTKKSRSICVCCVCYFVTVRIMNGEKKRTLKMVFIYCIRNESERIVLLMWKNAHILNEKYLLVWCWHRDHEVYTINVTNISYVYLYP